MRRREEQLELVAEHARGQGIAAAAGGQLGEQALGEGLAADAGGIEGLQQFQGRQDGVVGQAGRQRDVGRRLGQVAAVVEIAHQLAQRLEHRGRQVVERHLLHQVLLQRGLGGERVKEMLALLGVLRREGLRAAGVGHVVAPVLVELAEDLEFLAEIHLLALFALVGGRGLGAGLVG